MEDIQMGSTEANSTQPPVDGGTGSGQTTQSISVSEFMVLCSNESSNPDMENTLAGSAKDVPSTTDRFALSEQIASRLRRGLYWSVTTLPAPFAPWSPLPAHGEMETRACHCSKSRIHLLACGHTVAVPREAQKCAPNCAGMDMRSIIDAPPLPHDGTDEEVRTRQNPEAIIANRRAGLKSYAETFMVGPLGKGMEQALELHAISERMNFAHQIKGRPYAIKGAFACLECGNQGPRAAVPAYRHKSGLFQIIIPVRDEDDRTLVAALETGWRPRQQGNRSVAGRDRGSGHGGRPQQGRSNFDKTQNARHRGSGHSGRRQQGRHHYDEAQNARVTKARVQEKKRVINELQQEDIIDMISDMTMFGGEA